MLAAITVISILGGPGSGKGTQCAILQEQYHCAHFSVGDVLRAEAAKPDSPHANTIKENMESGRVGPKEITVSILRTYIEEAANAGIQTILLDGFPRKLDQAEYFEQHVAPVTCVSVFDCPQDVLLQRLSSRGRADDTIETIKRRIATFDETTSQVLKKYEARDIVTRIRSDCAVEAVTERLQQALQDCGVVLKLRETIA